MWINGRWKCKKGKELMTTANSFAEIDRHDDFAMWKIPPAPGTNQTEGFVEVQPLTQGEKNNNKRIKIF